MWDTETDCETSRQLLLPEQIKNWDAFKNQYELACVCFIQIFYYLFFLNVGHSLDLLCKQSFWTKFVCYYCCWIPFKLSGVTVIFFLNVFWLLSLSADKDVIKASTLPLLLKAFDEWDIFVKTFFIQQKYFELSSGRSILILMKKLVILPADQVSLKILYISNVSDTGFLLCLHHHSMSWMDLTSTFSYVKKKIRKNFYSYFRVWIENRNSNTMEQILKITIHILRVRAHCNL